MPGNDAFTKLLLHCDGVDGSVVFPDDSVSLPAHVVTANGNAEVDTAQKVFGTGSALFGGVVTDYLSAPSHADWNFGAGDFTIDFRTRFSSLPGGQGFFQQHQHANMRYHFYWQNSNDTLQFYVYTGAVLILIKSVAWLPVINTWYHIALVRHGNDWYIFVDGVNKTDPAWDFDISAMPSPVATFDIGKAIFATDGWIDEFRVSKGIARWTAGFTPPTAPYSTITLLAVNPNTGSTLGGTPVSVTGAGFVNGATITFGGNPATGVTFVNAARIDCVTPAGTGVVDVVLTNPGGESETLPAAFTYFSPPTIATQPTGASIYTEETATFSCLGAGAGTLAYQWRRNGVNIAGATAANYTTPAASYVENGDVFTCVVTTEYGSVTSDGAVLTVSYPPPPVITVQPQSVSVATGERATFLVVATAIRALTYQWKLNGTAISGATAASYTTPDLIRANNGDEYRCVVTVNPSVESDPAYVTVELPSFDADPLQLYQYFPAFVKMRDSDAGTDDAGEAILQKITYVLEKEAGAHADMLGKLLLSLDVDHCDTIYMDYLAFLLGERIPGDWGDEKRRWFLRQLPDLLKLKGLHLGFERRAAFAGRLDARAIELFKATVNETCDYVDEEDANHPHKAARIDVAECSTCEAYCQAGCEAGYQQVEVMSPAEANELINELGEVLPVNVLVREDCARSDPTSVVSPLTDTIGCLAACQVYAEEVWPGSEVEANFQDHLNPVLDTFVVTQECASRCEAACQTCCECGWEGAPCDSGCEVTCQTSCEYTCQTDCMASCQTDCQAGGCQWGCQVYCEPHTEV